MQAPLRTHRPLALVGILLALASCSSTQANPPPIQPAQAAPATFVESNPTPPALLTPALANLGFQPGPGSPNLLNPAEQRGVLEHYCTLRPAAQARVRLDDTPRSRPSDVDDPWSSEFSVLEWDPQGEGPVRILEFARARSIAVALYVDRSDLRLRIRETAPISVNQASDPSLAEPMRVRVTSSTTLTISLDGMDQDTKLLAIGSHPENSIRLTGQVRREDLALVTRRGELEPLECSSLTGRDEALRAEPREDAPIVAQLDNFLCLDVLSERDAAGWVQVVAFDMGIAAHGYIRGEFVEAYGVGGLGLVGTGRGGGSQTTIVVPADAPMFDKPDGTLSGRTLQDATLLVTDTRGDWTAVLVDSDWGDLELWVHN